MGPGAAPYFAVPCVQTAIAPHEPPPPSGCTMHVDGPPPQLHGARAGRENWGREEEPRDPSCSKQQLGWWGQQPDKSPGAAHSPLVGGQLDSLDVTLSSLGKIKGKIIFVQLICCRSCLLLSQDNYLLNAPGCYLPWHLGGRCCNSTYCRCNLWRVGLLSLPKVSITYISIKTSQAPLM